jgi:RND family efflux transporter MFP subunit
MTNRMKWFVALAAVGALAAAGYASVKRKPAETAQGAQSIVEFTQQDLYIVEPQAMERTLPLTGSLMPYAEATVKAKVAGELVAVTVREGEPVKQGQVLARIDQTEVQARVAARRADLGAARAQLDWAAKNRASQKALLEKGFIAQTAFDNVQSNYDVAVAKLRAAEAELVVAQKSLGDSVLMAPFAGIVSLRHAQSGERVALDGKVVTIVDLSRLQLEAAVPATEIGKLGVGQAVAFRVDGFGEQRFSGRIDRINPATVAGSRSIYVYALIDNPQGVLRAGLFAQGAVSLERIEGALVVPASAVREELGRNIVYALVDGKVQRRAVKVGPADAIDRVQVLEGLAPGDRIVRANLGTLREGTAARLAGPQAEASR